LRHIPAFCQARSRRQQVMPEPHPISCGSISQGIPDYRTNRMPVSTRLSSNGLRPGCVLRRRLTGNSGWTMVLHGIRREHFVRWLSLFNETVSHFYCEDTARKLFVVADRIAGRLQLGFCDKRSMTFDNLLTDFAD
jgi:hypothetical protein